MSAMNKKTFMAARGNRLSAFALLFLVFVVSLGLEFSYTANANFSTWVSAPTPIYDKPSIALLAPKGYVNIGVQTTILFTVAMPSTWESNLYVDGPPSLWGTIRNVTCYLDKKQILFDDTVYGRDAKPVTMDSTIVYPKNYPISINYSCGVNQVSSGFHNLTVYVAAYTFCQNWETIIDGYHYPCNYYQDVSANETFSFEVMVAPAVQQPAVSILYPLNNSFFNVSIEGVNYQLIYETNSTLSWVGYSIGGNGYSIEGKGSGNVTVSENSTWVHDFGSSGYHTLTLYANDTSGNWAIPHTVTYLVNFYPDYPPSPSPTPEPTLTPNQTAENTQNQDFTLTIVLAVVVVIASVAIAALVYFKRRKGKL